MDDKIETLIDGILQAEGWPEFTDDPDDKGGPTKGGITLDTLTRWRRRPTTALDVEAIGEIEVRTIYRHMYVIDPGYAQIGDELLRYNVVDAGILHGVGWASRTIQRVAGVPDDGDVGPKTLAAVNAAQAWRLSLEFTASRFRHVAAIVQSDARKRGHQGQIKWLGGWVSRTAARLESEAHRHQRS